jgi:paired amphipathic helix protein Sin3a
MDLRHEYNKELVAEFNDPTVHDDIMFLLLHVSELTQQDLKESKSLWKNVIIPLFDIANNAVEEKVEGDYVSKGWLSEISTQLSEEDPEYQPIVEQPLAKKSKRHLFFTNSTMLLFMRYYIFMYERLFRAKELAKREMRSAQKPEITADTIVRQHEGETVPPPQPTTSDDNAHYRQFMNALVQWIKGGDATVFEETARKLLGYEGWVTYTLDKVFANMQKPLHALLSDDMCMQLVDAFKYENQRTNRFLDHSYFIHAQKIVGHETCYMFEYHIDHHKLRVNIMNPPELDPEKVKAEAQGLEYVQKYLTVTTPDLEKTRRVFLQRNKKKMPQERANNDVSIMNGLECKICIATYKMYYVEDTEDYFARKKAKHVFKKRDSSKWTQYAAKRKELIDNQPSNNNAMDTSQ